MCWLFECGAWWRLLGVLDHLTAGSLSGAFYDAHNRVCPEVKP